MKVLWLVSFRPIGQSKSNDLFQSMFVDSVKSLNCEVYFSLTQFDEPNVEKFIKEKKIKKFYKNISKKKLPPGKKYSNKYMLSNVLHFSRSVHNIALSLYQINSKYCFSNYYF